MTFLTGVFYGLLSPLNPEFRSFFYLNMVVLF